MKIIVVIPTFNEKENITELIPEIFKQFKEHNLNGSVIVVDDNSPDGTAQEVKRLSKRFKVALLSREKKLGLGSAYVAGFKKALQEKADLVFEMDADFSHKPEYIPEFVKKINEGFDLVIGSRYMEEGGRPNYPLHRTLVSHGANYLIKFIASLPITDVTTGFRAYRKEVFNKLDLDSVKSMGYEFQLEMLFKAHRLGFRIGRIPIVFFQRKKGESKINFNEIKSFFVRAFQLRLGLIK